MKFLFWGEKTALYSLLSLADCQRSLQMTLGTTFNQELFVGRLKENRFRIFKRQTHKISFFPELNGIFIETKEGTLIYCKFSLWRPAQLFLYIFYALTFLLAIAGTANSYFKFCSETPNGGCYINPNSAYMVLPVFIFSVFVIFAGWHMSEEDKSQLLNFVRRTLDAKSHCDSNLPNSA
jgi:hypothetical protein